MQIYVSSLFVIIDYFDIYFYNALIIIKYCFYSDTDVFIEKLYVMNRT